MKQILKGIIDTQKMNYVPLGLVNISDTVLMDLDIRQNGEEVTLTNPTIELLARKQDGNKVRQLENIKYSNGKIAIDVDPEILTFKGSVACQIVIKENEERVSTCLFNFDVNGTIDSGIIIESKEKIKTLDDLQELIDIGFEDLNEYSRRLAELENEMLGTNSTINQNEVERNKSEQDRKTTFEGLKENYNDFKVEKDKEFEELKNDYQGFKGQKDEEFTELKIEMVEATNEVIETNLEATANESKRVEAEAKRVVDFNKTMDTAEATNKKLEATNTSINLEESKRVTSETTRKQAETTRVNAETSRATTFNTLKTNMETATNTSITEEGKRATTFNTLKTDMLNTEAQLKATDEQLTANEELREAEWEVLKKEPTTARKDYFNKTHNTLQERLNSDFDNVHQRVNDSSLIEYSGTNITANNSYYGLTKEHSIGGRTLQNLAPPSLSSTTKDNNGFFTSTKATWDYLYDHKFLEAMLLKPNTEYTFIFEVVENTMSTQIRFRGSNEVSTTFWTSDIVVAGVGQTRTFVTKNKTKATFDSNMRYGFWLTGGDPNTTTGSFKIRITMLEGDYTNTPLSELPYVEGIQSVGDKSKNIFDESKKQQGTLDGSNGAELVDNNFERSDFIEVKPLTKYVADNSNYRYFLYDSNKNFTNMIDGLKTFETTSTTKYIRLRRGVHLGGLTNTQIEQGTVATNYEPYYDGYRVRAKSCGKNIIDVTTLDNLNATSYGITFTLNKEEKCMILNGTNSGNYSQTPTKDITRLFTRGKHYVLAKESVGISIRTKDISGKMVYYRNNGKGFTFDNTIVEVIIFGSIEPTDTTTYSNFKAYIQIEEVPTLPTTPTLYTPYVVDSKAYYLAEPLRSLPNGTKDEIVGSTLIRRVGKGSTVGITDVRLNGTLTNTNRYFIKTDFPNSKAQADKTQIISNFSFIVSFVDDVEHAYKDTDGNLFIFSKIKDLAEFKSWLQANPTTVYYELATPIITELGEHLSLQTFAETTHIMSDNYMLPTQKAKVPTNVQAVISTLMVENENLNNEVNTLNLENEKLISTNEIQDELINVSLCATDEMYMMIEPLLSTMPMAFSINNDVERGSNSMVDMYVAMVMRGLKTIEEVPLRYRAEVKQILEDLEK